MFLLDLIGCGIIDVDYFIEVDNFYLFVVEIFSIIKKKMLLFNLIIVVLFKFLDLLN